MISLIEAYCGRIKKLFLFTKVLTVQVFSVYANKDEVGLQQPLKNGAVTPAHSTKSSSSGAQPVNSAAQSLLNSDEFIER